MIQEAIGKLVEGRHLSADEAEKVMDLIMTGEATQARSAPIWWRFAWREKHRKKSRAVSAPCAPRRRG